MAKLCLTADQEEDLTGFVYMLVKVKHKIDMTVVYLVRPANKDTQKTVFSLHSSQNINFQQKLDSSVCPATISLCQTTKF